MPTLVRTLGLVLAMAAAWPLSAQTVPPGGPYGGAPGQTWPDRAPRVFPEQQAAFEAEPAGQGLAPAPGGVAPGAAVAGATGPLRLPGHNAALPLPPRNSAGGTQPTDATGSLPSVVAVAGSLAAVLGLFFLVAWALRRAAPGQSAALPGEVVELLGRKVVGQRQQLELLRCGRKLLLVSVTPDCIETLTEITDPEEVDRLAGLCRQAQPGSATATFRQMFQQFSSERVPEGGRHG